MCKEAKRSSRLETLGFLDGPSTQGLGAVDKENNGSEGQVEVKPWTCARAQLFVKAPERKGRYRTQTLQSFRETKRL